MKSVISLILLITLPFFLIGQTKSISRIKTSEIEYNVNKTDPEDKEIVYKMGSKIPYTGIVYEKYENGKMASEVYYKNGLLDGQFTVWFENGNMAKKWNYSKGVTEGVYVEWWENGQKEQEGKYQNGKLEGLLTMWWENGQKKSEKNYKNGLLNGKVITWFEDGKKHAEGTSLGKDKLFGNYTEWHNNGQKMVEIILKEGSKQEWHFKNSLMGGITVWGISDGIYSEWYFNGQKKKEIVYANDKIVGEVKWDENGNVVK